jgi:LysM repeat protein
MTNLKSYLDLHYPLWLVNAANTVNSSTPDQSAQDREWLSQPRRNTDQTWEVLLYKFKTPAGIGEIFFDLLEISAEFQVYYKDRSGNRWPMPDRVRKNITGKINTGDPTKWYSFSFSTYPIVVTEIEIRIRRVQDSVDAASGAVNYSSLGLRNVLFKRNVYTRDDALIGFEPSLDPLGNYVEKTIKDWDPPKAADGNSFTFWKSEPQPTPDAVVSFYLDCRDSAGNGQLVDRFYLDPLYTNQQINVYYSTDDTVGTRRLSYSKLAPNDPVTDVVWKSGIGMDFSDVAADCDYELDTTKIGLMAGSSFWVGAAWIPNFASNSGPSSDLLLFEGTNHNFQVFWRSTAGKLSVAYEDDSATSHVVDLNGVVFSSGEEVRWAARVVQSGSTIPAGIYIDATVAEGTPVSVFSAQTSLTHQSLMPYLHMGYMKGVVTAFILKQETGLDSYISSWLQDPYFYLSPDPVLEDKNGVVPTTTLDNALVGVDWTIQELPYGGIDSGFFEAKIWSPIWKDWVVQRGYYFFPQPVFCTSLKLEFTNLTEQAYPVWEAGVTSTYLSYPINVLKTAQSIATTMTTTQTTNTTVNTLTTVNTSVTGQANTSSSSNSTTSSSVAKVNSKLTTATPVPDITVSVGNVSVSNVPHLFDNPVQTTFSQEVASSIVFRGSTSYSTHSDSSSTIQSSYQQTTYTQVASAAYYTVVSGDCLIKIAAKYNIPWTQIYNANKQLISSDPRVSRLPRRSAGWWIFPGQQLVIPGVVMETIANTQTITERKTTNVGVSTTVKVDTVTGKKVVTSTTRNRFTATSVHRYDQKTATRDSAMAYFSGIREVVLFRVNWIVGSDTPEYYIDNYGTTEFTLSGAEYVPSTNAVIPTGSGSHLLTSAEFPSQSVFKKIEIDSVDRPLTKTEMSGTLYPFVLVGSGLNTMWDDPTAKWNDSTATWGLSSPAPSVQLTTENNFYYSGRLSTKLYRESGSGESIAQTAPFALPNGARVRLGMMGLFADSTNNVWKLELVSGGTTLYSETLTNIQVGKWSEYRTRFFVLGSSYTDLQILISTTGTESSTLYVGSLYTESTTIVYSVSNDNGANYYEVTEIVNDPAGAFVFPTMDTRLKFKVSMGQTNDYLFGIRIRPLYIPQGLA